MTKGPFALIFYIAAILIITGCSRYIKFLERPEDNVEIILPKTRPTLCSLNKRNIIHNSQFTLDEFTSILKGLNNLTIAEKGLIYTLYQMAVRPDATDWSSRLQIHIRHGKNRFHQDFGNFAKLPLKQAFNDLKRQGYLARSLDFYIKLANKVIPRKLTIQNGLEEYLNKKISNDSSLINTNPEYFKIGKPLQKGESFKRHELFIPRNTENDKRPYVGSFSLGNEFNCSFDAELYKKGIFLISKVPYRENAFGLIESNGDYFFSVTQKTNDSLKKYQGQIFPGGAPSHISPFCQQTNPKRDLTLISLSSRDPGQLLYHLYNYQIQEAQSPQETLSYLNFPRHQFLTNPSRLLYESQKGSEEQLRYFLSLDFPVYHVGNLGLVYALWSDNETTTFIPDPRKPIYQSCKP